MNGILLLSSFIGYLIANKYSTRVKELEDIPQSLLSLYAGIEYLNSDDIDQRFVKINKVTKANVINLASKIHLDTIYLLEGDTNAKK